MQIECDPKTAQEQILLYLIAGAGLVLVGAKFGVAALPFGLVPFFAAFAFFVWRARRANAKGGRQ